MTAAVQVDARKHTLGKAEALALLKKADELYAAKGKKVVHLDLKSANMDEAAALLLGPTENLRAPTLVKGKTVLVGFDEATYQKLLK